MYLPRRVYLLALALWGTPLLVGALEFEPQAKKMGLEGLAWDNVFTVYAADNDLAKETLANIEKVYANVLAQLNQKRLNKKCLVFVWKNRYKFVLQARTFSGGSDITSSGGVVTQDGILGR